MPEKISRGSVVMLFLFIVLKDNTVQLASANRCYYPSCAGTAKIWFGWFFCVIGFTDVAKRDTLNNVIFTTSLLPAAPKETTSAEAGDEIFVNMTFQFQYADSTYNALDRYICSCINLSVYRINQPFIAISLHYILNNAATKLIFMVFKITMSQIHWPGWLQICTHFCYVLLVLAIQQFAIDPPLSLINIFRSWFGGTAVIVSLSQW